MPHFPMFPPIAALFLVAIFAAADRVVGSANPSRSTGMALGVFGGGGLALCTLGAPFAVLGLIWAAWRSLPFWNGSLAPQTTSQRVSAVLRYALWIPLAVLAYWAHGDVVLLALALLIAAIATSAMRFDYGGMVAHAKALGVPLVGDFNATVEIVSGAAFGAAFAAYAIFHAHMVVTTH